MSRVPLGFKVLGCGSWVKGFRGSGFRLGTLIFLVYPLLQGGGSSYGLHPPALASSPELCQSCAILPWFVRAWGLGFRA